MNQSTFLIDENTLKRLADAVRTKLGISDPLTLEQIIEHINNFILATEQDIAEYVEETIMNETW